VAGGEVVVTEARNVPRLTDVAARVHLTTLELTKDGDVFYLVAEPGYVWENCPMRSDRDYRFITTGTDMWNRMKDIGDGDPKQSVVVIHNTRNHLREGE
jgi:hypothetical protein